MLTDETILVTGAAGTIGREIVRQLLAEWKPAEVRAVDNNESEVFLLEEEYRPFTGSRPATYFHAHVGDVRDGKRMTELMRGVTTVFHLAALKHVIVCEKSPIDAVQTNIEGVQNVINAAAQTGVKRVIFTSSDKAVNPTNVMGTSKLMGERLITAANNLNQRGDTIFSSTRFGNVVGSRGSVVPLFYNQIRRNGPLTLTDERMTRFIMTIPQSARLVISASRTAKGGEVFVMKMPVVRILDLAEVMVDILAPQFDIDPSGITIKRIGAKPGEKMYEELMSDEETKRAVELSDGFAVLPAFRNIYGEIDYTYKDTMNLKVENPYVSEKTTPMTKDEIREFLVSNHVFGTKR